MFCRTVSSSWWVILLPSFAIDALAIFPLFSFAATARTFGPQAAVQLLLQRPGYLITLGFGNPFCACFHFLLAESLQTTRGATLIWPLMHLATPLYTPALLVLLVGSLAFFTASTSRIAAGRWMMWAAALVCAITVMLLRVQDVVIANGPPAPVRPPYNISNPNATWHASTVDCSTPFNCGQIAAIIPSWSVAFVPVWSMMIFAIVFNIFDCYTHVMLFTFGMSKAGRTVFHLCAYGISAVFLALYLDSSITWPLAWVLSPIVLHAAVELLLLMLSHALAPRSPTNLAVACSDGSATVTWTNSQALSCTPVRFIVDLKPDRSDVWLRKHVGRECSFSATSLPPSRTFVFRVMAQDPSGALSPAVLSQPFTILHRMPSKPDAPRALKFIRQIRRNKNDSRDISVSLLAVVAWLKAEEGASFTLEAATLLSDENSWRVIYTGPLLEARVPNIPPATAFKMRLTVSTPAALRSRAAIDPPRTAGANGLWHVATVGHVVLHHSEVRSVTRYAPLPFVTPACSAADIMNASGFNAYVADDAEVSSSAHACTSASPDAQQPCPPPQVSDIAIQRPSSPPTSASRLA